MNNSESKAPLTGLRMIIAGILCYVGVLLYMPNAGMIRTLPFVVLFAAIADVVYKEIKYTLLCAGLFTFVMLSINGNSIMYSAVFTLLGVVFSAIGIYGIRLLRAAYKTKNKELKKRCTVRSILVLAVCFVLYMLACGNIFSFLAAQAENVRYIRDNYTDKVKIQYTSFDASEREYKTYISFKHDGYVVGESDECYISKNKDMRRDYLEGLLLDDAKKQLKVRLSNAVDMFEITSAFIGFEQNEILDENAVYTEYLDRTSYVVSLYHIVSDRESFAKLCADCCRVLAKDEEFDFGEIVICGGNANEVLYTFTVDKDSVQNVEIEESMIKDFDEKTLEKYGVTEKTVLDYWYNR